MNGRLLEAAWSGNVEYLFKLHEEDRSTLHNVALAWGENPLHIACLVGHLDFVRGILKLKKEFASELNQDGLSPLHIAAANGHVEIGKEILLVLDPILCQLEGRERMIPLHFAAIKGSVGVIRELLSVSADSIEKTTARGETVLHLAVKNHQFQAFKVLAEHLNEFSKDVFLNERDGQGNTVLHLAVSRKQYEVIDFVLRKNRVTEPVIEVNPLNKMALTPLDLLLQFQSEAGDREIEEILRQAGATRANDQVNTTDTSSDPPVRNHPSRSPGKRLLEYFMYNNIKDSPKNKRNTLLVIAILITTATYQAVLSPPGGVWQDDSPPSSNNTTIIGKPHIAGQAIMGTQNKVSYGLFLTFNSIGFFTSVHMIFVLTAGFPMELELHILLLALVVTYDTSMGAIIQNKVLSNLFIALSVALPFTIPAITRILSDYPKRPSDALPSTNQPVVA